MPDSPSFIPLKMAVLTISDSRSLDDDISGALLKKRAIIAGHQVVEHRIVADEAEQIKLNVRQWIDNPSISVIITTGGTGLTGRDITPDVLSRLYDKPIPGFGEIFRQLSYAKIKTSTIQSRASAGVANGTYIFCLPGSPGACRDGWDEILRHQLDNRTKPCNLVDILPRLKER